MDILYWSRFRMRVIGRCDNETENLNAVLIGRKSQKSDLKVQIHGQFFLCQISYALQSVLLNIQF